MIRIEPRRIGMRLPLERLMPPTKIIKPRQKPGRKPRDVIRVKP
jgi:hypothetical protein